MATPRAVTHPNEDGFPVKLSGPALRALAHAGIRTTAQLSKHTEADVAALHGIGPKAMRTLKTALSRQGRKFRAG